MSFDQPQRSRKCLLQNKTKNGRQTGIGSSQPIMVEPAPFDIYLCDNCDAELYSKEAMEEHEKTCNMDDDDDDDVILCDTPEPPDEMIETNQQAQQSQHIINANNNNSQTVKSDNENDDEMRKQFLLNFNLRYRKDSPQLFDRTTASSVPTTVSNKDDFGLILLDKNRRMPRRNRAAATVTRCPTLPLSSPAGQLLLRTTKTSVSTDYLTERLERVERFCHAPVIARPSNRPKFFDKKLTSIPHCTFKKPPNYSTHTYVFPRRHFSQRRKAENFLFLNSSLIKRCRPISVRLKKMPENDVVKRKSANAKLNIKLTRDTTPNSSNWKITPQQTTEIIVDTINLCSSDEDTESKPKDNKPKTTKKLSPTTIKQINKNVNISTANDVSAVASTSRACLQKLNASSELSIIPIIKTALDDSKMRPPPPPPPLIRIKTPSSQINDLMAGTYPLNNIVRQPTSTTTLPPPQPQKFIENGTSINFTKPLRPVYLYSNYGSPNALNTFATATTTTTATSATVTSITEAAAIATAVTPVATATATIAVGIINESVTTADLNITKTTLNNNDNNQENHQKVQKVSQTLNSNIRKRNHTQTERDWSATTRTSVAAINTNVVGGGGVSGVGAATVASTNVVGHEQRSSKSLPLPLTNFGSPSRVVSIDLTT